MRNEPGGITPPDYQPLLVLQLAELTAADAMATPSGVPVVSEAQGATDGGSGLATARLVELDDLITLALSQLAQASPGSRDTDVVLRLRLLRSSYDANERTSLLASARQLRLPRPHAALVLAGQARRDALDGSAEFALEHWRQAVSHAIHVGHTDDARGWLYAIRAVNSRFGPWTSRIDEEHLLAQALPKSGSGRLIRRVRDPETDARRAALDKRPIEALRAARRWLADSIVLGDWVDEHAATELLGDLYATNAEPERATACYQWAGETKKLTELANSVGDRLLPPAPLGSGPWWQQSTSLAGIAEQNDLLDDGTAGRLLPALLDLVARGRAGELIEGPTQSLTLQATRTAGILAGRGTSADAQALLDLFAGDVAREENQYRHHDEQHVQACKAMSRHHPDLTWPAVTRIFDLAEVGTDASLKELNTDFVLNLLREALPDRSTHSGTPNTRATSPLTGQQRQELRDRLRTMAAAGRYEAGVAVASLGGTDDAVTERGIQARDRLLNRPEPEGHSVSFGSRMVPDSYLVTFLEAADQQACLEKMLTVADDRREAAPNRQDALTAASNLVLGQSDDIKARVHTRSRPFVEGRRDGSHLEDETTNPHPLSTMRIDFGPASLRAAGLRLAHFSAVTDDERLWVRDGATAMLASDDASLVRQAAETLFGVSADALGDLDAALLAGHPLPIVRQLAAIVAVASPVRYDKVLQALAVDSDRSVRKLLARRLHEARTQTTSPGTEPYSWPGEHDGPRGTALVAMTEALRMLTADVRHSVRRAATGRDS